MSAEIGNIGMGVNLTKTDIGSTDITPFVVWAQNKRAHALMNELEDSQLEQIGVKFMGVAISDGLQQDEEFWLHDGNTVLILRCIAVHLVCFQIRVLHRIHLRDSHCAGKYSRDLYLMIHTTINSKRGTGVKGGPSTGLWNGNIFALGKEPSAGIMVGSTASLRHPRSRVKSCTTVKGARLKADLYQSVPPTSHRTDFVVWLWETTVHQSVLSRQSDVIRDLAVPQPAMEEIVSVESSTCPSLASICRICCKCCMMAHDTCETRTSILPKPREAVDTVRVLAVSRSKADGRLSAPALTFVSIARKSTADTIACISHKEDHLNMPPRCASVRVGRIAEQCDWGRTYWHDGYDGYLYVKAEATRVATAKMAFISNDSQERYPHESSEEVLQDGGPEDSTSLLYAHSSRQDRLGTSNNMYASGVILWEVAAWSLPDGQQSSP
ncbi:hypothetical protein BKA93DRAFT_753501 [Sparassis latifolia]